MKVKYTEQGNLHKNQRKEYQRRHAELKTKLEALRVEVRRAANEEGKNTVLEFQDLVEVPFNELMTISDSDEEKAPMDFSNARERSLRRRSPMPPGQGQKESPAKAAAKGTV